MFVCMAACATIKVSTPVAPSFFKSTPISYFQKYHLHRPMSACSFRFKHAESTCVGASGRPQTYQQTLDVRSCLSSTIMLGTVKSRSKGFNIMHMLALCRSLFRFQSHSQNCLQKTLWRLLNPWKSLSMFSVSKSMTSFCPHASLTILESTFIMLFVRLYARIQHPVQNPGSHLCKII